MSTSSEWHPVRPQGLAASIFGVTITFATLLVVVVSLRVKIRLQTRSFGREDTLMCVGLVCHQPRPNGIVIWGTLTGVGAPNSELDTSQLIQGAELEVLWQLFYVSGPAFIKASICTQLIRLAVRQRYIYVLYGVISIIFVTTLIAMIAVLVRCKRIAASWDTSLGTCISRDIIITLTYVVSGVNIFTDWCTAVMPVFILWNLQMAKNIKILSGLMLGVGVLASVATIIRMPYSGAYSQTSNQLYAIGYIILWMAVECDLGIIAGSLPTLRTLLAKSLGKVTGRSSDKTLPQDGVDLVTIGRIRGRHNPIYNTVVNVTVAHESDKGSAADDSSTRNMVRVTHVGADPG